MAPTSISAPAAAAAAPAPPRDDADSSSDRTAAGGDDTGSPDLRGLPPAPDPRFRFIQAPVFFGLPRQPGVRPPDPKPDVRVHGAAVECHASEGEAGGSEGFSDEDETGATERFETNAERAPAVEDGQRIITVPPGRLFLTLGSFKDGAGAVVKAIGPSCALKEEIRVGDRIVSIDGAKPSKIEDLLAGTDRVRKLGIRRSRMAEIDAFLRGRGCLSAGSGVGVEKMTKSKGAGDFMTFEDTDDGISNESTGKHQQQPQQWQQQQQNIEQISEAKSIEADRKRKRIGQLFVTGKRKKYSKTNALGFDIIAEELDSKFYRMMLEKPPSTNASYNIRTAIDRLRTSFSASYSSVKKVPVNPGNNAMCVTDDEREGKRIRRDCPTTIRSSKNRGMQRLKLLQIVSLGKLDEFTLVVPPTDRKVPMPKVARQSRKDVIRDFKRVILSAVSRRFRLSNKGKEEHYAKDMMERKISMNGKDSYEYNVRIVDYPERAKLEEQNISHSERDRLLEEAGLHLELIGYRGARPLFLRLSLLPYLHVYVPREPDGPFLDKSLDFPHTTSKETVLRHLVREFHATKGDPVAYVQIMMNYYKKRLQMTKDSEKVAGNGASNEHPPKQSQQDLYGHHWDQIFFQLMLCRANSNGSLAIPRCGRRMETCEVDVGNGNKQVVNIGVFLEDMRRYKQLLLERDQKPDDLAVRDKTSAFLTSKELEIKTASVLTPDRIKVLDSIGFVWTRTQGKNRNQRWEEWYNELVRHHAAHGHCEPKDNPRLSQWCQSQRSLNKVRADSTVRASATAKDKVGKAQELGADMQKQECDIFKKIWEERKAKLDKLGFSWSLRNQVMWEDRFEQLKQYEAEHGHCRVPKEKGALGRWCAKNRLQYQYYIQGKKESTMTAKRIELLESIGFEWRLSRGGMWQKMFEQLKQYHAEHGHCRVPKGNGPYKSLGKWCRKNRLQYQYHIQGEKESQMTAKRIELLESIGFEWRQPMGPMHQPWGDEQWEKWLEQLKQFHASFGHCNVSIEYDQTLYCWCMMNKTQYRHYTQGRMNQAGAMSAKRIELLESLGFEWSKKQSSNDIAYQPDSGDEYEPGPPLPQAQASNKDSDETELDNANSPSEGRDQYRMERNAANEDATSTYSNDIVGSEDEPNQLGEDDGPLPPRAKSPKEQARQTQTGLDCSSKSTTQYSTQQQAGASLIAKPYANTNTSKEAAKLAEGKPKVSDPQEVGEQKVKQCAKKEPDIPEHFMAEIFKKYVAAKFEHGDELPIGCLATLVEVTKKELNMESVEFSSSNLKATLHHKWRKLCVEEHKEQDFAEPGRKESDISRRSHAYDNLMAEIFNKYAMAKFEYGDELPIGLLASLLDDTKSELNMESVDLSASDLATSLEHKWRKFSNK